MEICAVRRPLDPEQGFAHKILHSTENHSFSLSDLQSTGKQVCVVSVNAVEPGGICEQFLWLLNPARVQHLPESEQWWKTACEVLLNDFVFVVLYARPTPDFLTLKARTGLQAEFVADLDMCRNLGLSLPLGRVVPSIFVLDENNSIGFRLFRHQGPSQCFAQFMNYLVEQRVTVERCISAALHLGSNHLLSLRKNSRDNNYTHTEAPPYIKLPLEVLAHVFTHIDDTPSLLSAASVCKSWHAAVQCTFVVCIEAKAKLLNTGCCLQSVLQSGDSIQNENVAANETTQNNEFAALACLERHNIVLSPHSTVALSDDLRQLVEMICASVRNGDGDLRQFVLALKEVGNAHFRKGQTQLAQLCYEHVLAGASKVDDELHSNILSNLGAVHARLEHVQLGLSFCDEALRLNPRNPTTRFNRARMLLKLLRFDEAKRDLQVVVSSPLCDHSLRMDAKDLLEQL